MLSLIAAVADNGVIGSNNGLPWYLPADLKHFKELTLGHTVVMGRKTYDSIVARLGHALPGRQNVVVTRQHVTYPDAAVLHDLSEIAAFEGAFIIGGAELYRETLGLADTLYITEVRAEIQGDVVFPAIDKSVWHEVARESHKKDEKNQLDYDFVTYARLRSSG